VLFIPDPASPEVTDLASDLDPKKKIKKSVQKANFKLPPHLLLHHMNVLEIFRRKKLPITYEEPGGSKQ
jgi:hypothetical protein